MFNPTTESNERRYRLALTAGSGYLLYVSFVYMMTVGFSAPDLPYRTELGGLYAFAFLSSIAATLAGLIIAIVLKARWLQLVLIILQSAFLIYAGINYWPQVLKNVAENVVMPIVLILLAFWVHFGRRAQV
jgi:hypothetical protein